MGNGWNSVKEGAGNVVDSAGSAISGGLSAAGEATGETFEWLANGASEAVGQVEEIFSGIGDSISSSLSGIGDWIGENLWTPISDGAINVINFFVGLGATILGVLGEAFAPIADWFVENVWTPIAETASEAWTSIGEAITEGWEGVSEFFSSIADWFVESVWTPISETATEAVQWIMDAWSGVSEWFGEIWTGVTDIVSEVWQGICDVASSAVETISGIWSGVVDFLSGVWQGIADTASAAWSYITSAVNSAWETISGLWGAAVAWFQGTVWGPISSAVDSVKSAISNAFQAAYNAVTGIFSGLAGWFESNVIGPVKAKFNALRDLGASITGLHAGGESAKANGGFVNSPIHALIGEAGPEVIIPLSPSRRNRAMDLLQRTQSMIAGDTPVSGFNGQETFTDMIAPVNSDSSGDSLPGLAYTATAENEQGENGGSDATPVMPPTSNAGSTQSVSVNLGGFTPTITIQAGDSANADDILQVIRQNIGDLADEFAGRIAEVTSRIHANQAIEME